MDADAEFAPSSNSAAGTESQPPSTPNDQEAEADMEDLDMSQDQTTTSDQTQQQRTKKKGARVKPSLRIASLNVKGHRNVAHVNQILRDKRIAALLLQETHMDETRAQALEDSPSGRMTVFASKDPSNPTGKGGVAIVVNRQLINPKTATSVEIVPGRALMVTILQKSGDPLSILNVYAPNDPSENKAFWIEIEKWFLDRPGQRRPDMMAGDFNMVEDAIDRWPSREDSSAVVDALHDLKSTLHLQDGWRTIHPERLMHSFLSQSNGSQSRIDRIYVRHQLMESNCFRDWVIEPSGIQTADHDLVSVLAVDEQAPEVGPGNWTLPAHLLNDQILLDFIETRGQEASKSIAALRGRRGVKKNPQRIWFSFENDVLAFARQREKATVPKLVERQRKVQKEMKETSEDKHLEADARAKKLLELRKELAKIAVKLHQKKRDKVAARHQLDAETMSKYWTRLAKAKEIREPIPPLRTNKPRPGDQVIHESDPAKMADIARSHHEALQSDGLGEVDEDERAAKIAELLRGVDAKPTPEQSEMLGALTTEDDLEEALKVSDSDSAPGLNGAQFSLWKSVHERYKKSTVQEDVPNSFNVLNLLCAAVNDIEKHGIDKLTGFANGWMCPIYKKGEKDDIANYRPITCLNTDYKLYTKVLATKLGLVAPRLIHRAQAGFIAGRQISGHTKLTRMVMQFAERTGWKGLVVALDQEKAYDKVRHDYLWATLAAFGIPEQFIFSVKNLYLDAQTSVMINGHLSKPFKVTRGVRQGDPLSCLLFDLAIEPLAIALRNSHLEGIKIPNSDERLVESMFADDTTVYLSENDNFSDLKAILDEWCLAAGAKFNVGKTEAIIVGKRAFRQKAYEDRRLTPTGETIPDEYRLIREGETMRILGARFGNDFDVEAPWASVLEKIDADLSRWSALSTTLLSRRFVIQMVVGGRTQYLTQVQGMPETVEKRLEKTIRKYLWDSESSSPVNMETAKAPIEEGGLAILDLQARNNAIAMTWLKRYLAPPPLRELWANFADHLFAINTPASEKHVHMKAKINVFLQSWKTYISLQAGVTRDLKELLTAAQKSNLRLDAIAFSTEIQQSMPIWYHAEAPALRRLTHAKASKCLMLKHNVSTVGDAEHVAAGLDAGQHIPWDECECPNCVHAGDTLHCEDPHQCMTRAKLLLDKLPPKWDPRRPDPDRNLSDVGEDEEGWVTIDKSVTCRGSTADALRVFGSGEKNREFFHRRRLVMSHGSVQMATDGSCEHNGEDNARAGAGGYAGPDHEANFAVRLPEFLPQSNQTGELAALMLAAQKARSPTKLLLETDSRYAKNALCTHRDKHEDIGYIGIANRELIIPMVAAFRRRQTETKIRWVKAHAGHELNEGADEMAKTGAGKPHPDALDLRVPAHLMVTGAKLAVITQKLAYQAIREAKMSTYQRRPRTVSNLERAKSEAEDAYDCVPSSAAIWRGIRNKVITKKGWAFLWKTAHDAFMVGDKWQRPCFDDKPELRARAECSHPDCCSSLESMEHILTFCEAPGQKLIWALVRELFAKKSGGRELPYPSIGLVIACGTPSFKDENGRRNTGLERLFTILVSEAARLIWILRCERVLGDKGTHTDNEVHNRFVATLNARLKMDRITSDVRRWGKKAIPPQKVIQTWRGLLENEKSLPQDWTSMRHEGVLVGIRPRREDAQEGVMDIR